MSTHVKMRPCVLGIIVMLMIALVFSMPEMSSAASKKPGRVTGLKVVSTSYDSVTLKWKKARKAKKYEIYRAAKKGGKYKKIKTVKSTSFKNVKLKTNNTYVYKVRAISGGKRGKYSRPVIGKPALGKPTFKARSASKGPKLTAGKVKGATGYVFYRDGVAIAKQKSNNFVDTNIEEGSTHLYKAVAYREYKGKTSVSRASRTLAASMIDIRVKLEDCTTVTSLTAGQTFDIKGKVIANAQIDWVEIGIVDKRKNAWVKKAKYEKHGVNSLTFDVARAKSSINFKALYGGVFAYRIYAHFKDESTVTVLNKTFIVSKGKGASAIVNMAKLCAWPYGTPKAKYRYSSGKRTEGYVIALDVAYGKRKNWSKQCRMGASCDVFVGAVIRATGYDKGFPRGLGSKSNEAIVKYCKKNPKKWALTGIKSESKMKPGDIIFQRYKSGGGHIMVYMGGGKVANAHYYGKSYGVIEDYSKIVKKPANCKIFNVYRAIN